MLKGKYFAGICTFYLIVFVICFYIPMPWFLHLAVTFSFLFLLALSIFVKRKHLQFTKRSVAIFLIGVFFLTFSFGFSEWFVNKNLTPAKAYTDKNMHLVTAAVEDVRYEKAYGSAYVLSLESVDGKSYVVGALFDVPFAGALAVGDRIEFESILEPISDEYEYYHRSRGILLTMTAEDFTYLDSEPREPKLFERIRIRISENFEKHIGGTSADYATALLTGDRDDLDGQIRLAYQRLGISHVLAVSGMHFSVIIGGFDFLLRLLTFPRRKKNLILILFSFIFAGICGFSASILRALVMFCMYYIADNLGEKSDSLTSLSFAAASIVTANPWAVYDAGFWLSVLSTLGILLIMPSLQKFLHQMLGSTRKGNHFVRLGKKFICALVCMIAMNFTALFFTMPVTYLLYGGISLISPLANLIFIPLTELILYLLIALTIFGFIPIVAPCLGAVCRFLIETADALALSMSDLHDIYISIRYPFAIYILLAMIVGICIVLFVGEFRVRKMFAVFLASMLVFGICFGVYTKQGENMTNLYLHTDGKSDVLGLIDDGEVLLIDITTGGKRVPKQASETLADYYACEIDTYLVTHLHDHHAGTLKSLADDIKLHRILLPEAETEKDEEYIDAIQSTLDGSCELVFYQRNGAETVTVGDTTLTLPDYQMLSRSSHPAVFLSAKTEEVGAWVYCGSASMEFSEHWDIVREYRTVIFGSHGPRVKNIFEDDCLADAELVLFTSEDTAKLIDLTKPQGKVAMVDEEYHIRFKH